LTPFLPALFVPEPSTWAMMVMGFRLLGLAAIRREWREAVSAA
jgi:hypothetical protein